MAQSKSDKAYAILRGRIMDGTYGPGHRLVLDQLRRETDISTIPWRESLRRLEAEGWVEIVQHSGARVRTFDTGSWMQSMRVIARLEGLAASLSVGRMSADQISYARQLNVDMKRSLEEFDPQRFQQLNNHFHEEVCRQCDDAHLFDLLESEWSRLELIRRSAFWYAPGRAMKSISEHETILDLIEGDADPELVESAARNHYLNTLEAVIAHQQAIDPTDP